MDENAAGPSWPGGFLQVNHLSMKDIFALVIINNGNPLDSIIIDRLFSKIASTNGINISYKIISIQGCYTYIKQHNPNLIIIDERITYDYSIYRFLTIMKTITLTSMIPVAVMGLMETKQEIINGGAFFYIKKPLTELQLMGLLNTYVHQKPK